MTELPVGTGAESLYICIARTCIENRFEINRKHILMADLIVVHFFIYLTVRPSTDGKRAPLTAINLQAAGSPQQAPPTYIAKMWKLIKFRKNVIFSRNHTDINPDDWTITKKTIRTTIHENFTKMKNLKVDRWALSLNQCQIWQLSSNSW